MKLLLLFVAIMFFLVSDICGYIIYCPCMGRFGNQADQFLGTLEFAKKINRILVLPPFIEFIEPSGIVDLYFRPFNDMFVISELRKYHRVLTMEHFMDKLAPSVWPKGQRKVFCYTRENDKVDCRVKDGRPFKHFWDHFGVDFDEHISLGSLHISDPPSAWEARFPQKKYPVLAFVGALGSFPIQESTIPLHRYLMWNTSFSAQVDELINSKIQRPYVAIHLRNEVDFDNVCKLVDENSNRALFDSAQCHGYASPRPVTKSQCSPSQALVIAHTRQMMAQVGAKALFVATDRLDLEMAFRRALEPTLEVFQSTNKLQTHLKFDLALLGRADGAVLNCVSSFSAFARRERDVRGLKTEYFGFSPLKKTEL